LKWGLQKVENKLHSLLTKLEIFILGLPARRLDCFSQSPCCFGPAPLILKNEHQIPACLHERRIQFNGSPDQLFGLALLSSGCYCSTHVIQLGRERDRIRPELDRVNELP
jgi:hypothetical protein